MRHRLVGSPRLWEMKRRFQFDFLVCRGLVPDDHLLDLGCGTLRGGIPLIAYLDPGHYTGIDVRSEAIDEGRLELARWREFPLVWRSMAMYRDIAADAGMTVEDIGSLGELGHVSGVAEQDAQRMLRFTRT